LFKPRLTLSPLFFSPYAHADDPFDYFLFFPQFISFPLFPVVGTSDTPNHHSSFSPRFVCILSRSFSFMVCNPFPSFRRGLDSDPLFFLPEIIKGRLFFENTFFFFSPSSGSLRALPPLLLLQTGARRPHTGWSPPPRWIFFMFGGPALTYPFFFFGVEKTLFSGRACLLQRSLLFRLLRFSPKAFDSFLPDGYHLFF